MKLAERILSKVKIEEKGSLPDSFYETAEELANAVFKHASELGQKKSKPIGFLGAQISAILHSIGAKDEKSALDGVKQLGRLIKASKLEEAKKTDFSDGAGEFGKANKKNLKGLIKAVKDLEKVYDSGVRSKFYPLEQALLNAIGVANDIKGDMEKAPVVLK